MRTAVVLVNLGAPGNLGEVKPFLKQLFSDPDIFSVPFGKLGQSLFSNVIATLRAPRSKKFYEAIGGGSPLVKNTNEQASALQDRFQDQPEITVFSGQRYWHPFIEEIVDEIRADRFERIILIPLFPHYSTTTTLSIINEWNRHGANLPKPLVVERFYGLPEYSQACADSILESLQEFDENPHILFSAHSIPESRVKAGDTYVDEIRENMLEIMEKIPRRLNHSLAFQSKVGPVQWVGPPLHNELTRLIKLGVKYILIYPISFVSEHVETLYELDIEYAGIARQMGFRHFMRASTVQTSGMFIDVLEKLVRERI